MDREFLKTKTEELIALCRGVSASGKRLVVTGHDMPDADSILSAALMQKLLAKFDVCASIQFATEPDGVTLRDMSTLGVMGGILFAPFSKADRLLLVDHHVSPYEGVFACVDHHTTPPTPQLDYSLVLKASSCGKILYDMMLSCDVADDESERLAIFSVYLDTQSCRSPKFDGADRPWLEEGITRLHIDRAEITKMGFVLIDPTENAETLALYGYKHYEFNGRQGASSCIQIDVTLEETWQSKIAEILDCLKNLMQKQGVFIWAFVVNKPEIARSDIYFLRASGCEAVRLDRLASRSRDVVPVVKEEAERV